MALSQAVLLGLIALIITPGYFFYFDVTPKVVALLLGTAVLLVWPRRAAPGIFSVLILLNLASLALSTAFSTRPGLSLVGTSWREFGLVPQAAALLFAWTVATASDGARVILRGVSVAGIVAGAYGIAQYFGWDPLLPPAAYHIGEGIWTIVRPPGTMGYVSYFATWLAMAAFIGVALAQDESAPKTNRAWRFLAWASAAICAVAMLLTGTRAAMLGLAAGAAVWLWLRNVRLTRNMGRRVAAVAMLVVLAGAAFYYSPAGWNLRSRARWFAEDPAGGGRLLLWRDTLRMSAARPFAGFGPETFTAQFPHFESAELARLRPDYEWESPHNMFLDALASQGIVGLIALAALCVAALRAGFREPRKPMHAGLTAALVAGIVSQEFSVVTVPTAAMFYVICGLLIRTGWNRRFAPDHAAIRIPIAAVLAAFAIQLALADRSLAQAQNRLEAGDSSSAAASYANYRTFVLPGESAADLWYSRGSLDLARRTSNPAVRIQALTQAQSAAARATQTADDPFNAWYNLAAFDAVRSDGAAAERHLRLAIAARPNWFKPHWTLARLLLLESRTAEAEPEAALALYLDGAKHPEVSQTLADVRARLHR